MPAWGLCSSCVRIDGFLAELTEPEHCYGTGDRPSLPGVIGGFMCSCPCRDWSRPERNPHGN